MRHIRLNTIFYTHVEHRPTNAIYIMYSLKKAMKAMKSNHVYINDHITISRKIALVSMDANPEAW